MDLDKEFFTKLDSIEIATIVLEALKLNHKDLIYENLTPRIIYIGSLFWFPDERKIDSVYFPENSGDVKEISLEEFLNIFDLTLEITYIIKSKT